MHHAGIAASMLAAWNLVVFAVYGVDKFAAKQNKRRVSEKTLLLLAVFFGSAGALLGMLLFRHKTTRMKFKIVVPLLLLAHSIAILFGMTAVHPQISPAVASRAPTTEPSAYRKITPAEAKERMEDDNAVILDVRTAEEFQESHITGAILIPQTDIVRLAPELLPEKDTTILVYCRSGVRSALAANALVELGYTNVYDFGGILDWPYAL